MMTFEIKYISDINNLYLHVGLKSQDARILRDEERRGEASRALSASRDDDDGRNS